MKKTIQYTTKQNKIQEINELDQNPNGEHQKMEEYQNKIGANIPENLKKVIQLFGKNMKKNSGKITMPE